jgi:hypothetical protein
MAIRNLDKAMLASRGVQQKGDIDRRMAQSCSPVIHREWHHATLALRAKQSAANRKDKKTAKPCKPL